MFHVVANIYGMRNMAKKIQITYDMEGFMYNIQQLTKWSGQFEQHATNCIDIPHVT